MVRKILAETAPSGGARGAGDLFDWAVRDCRVADCLTSSRMPSMRSMSA